MTNNRPIRLGETTGRYLVLLPETEISSGMRALTNSVGISSSDRASVFDELGVAVVSLNPDQVNSVRAAISAREALVAIEPERIVYAIGNDFNVNVSANYLKGYRDAVNHLVDGVMSPEGQITTTAASDGSTTWGLQATKVVDSPYSGVGIKVAVLDTGLDLTHPDFNDRSITSRSFIDGEEVQDGNGHGTHCIGTACGSKDSSILPRYGVAYNAEIFAGKVLSNGGSGADGGILDGINWAITNGCQIISMSLGARTRRGDTYSQIYETVAKRALSRGTLIIAAAGNESYRPGFVAPVGYPANCPSIMAVAAVDSQLQNASFSNGSINPDGGQVDITAPGVDVYSTWYMPTRYQTISGTSMATPHVSGIAALYAEATGKTGLELWGLLMRDAQRLSLSSVDVGVGLVQAPV